jgi:hypothetical protein
MDRMRRRSLLALLAVPVAVPVVRAVLPDGAETPEAALAGGSPVWSDSIPVTGRLHRTALGSAGVVTPRLATRGYRQVAVTWIGQDGTVAVRTRSGRRWSDWRELAALDDLPEDEGNGRRGSELLWVDPSDGVQVRVAGRTPSDLRIELIDPGVLPADATPVADRVVDDEAAGPQVVELVAATATSGAPRPPLIGRAKWGADEDWRTSPPRYNTTIKQVHVHHTASSNDYTLEDVPAILRGMYRYHTKTLGWSDLGYNFLVDKFGRTWIGRAGGYDRPVRGAHTLGFNHSSVGVAMIGNFETKRPSDASVSAVVRLAAWKLDLYGRKPATRTWVRSQGSDLYPDGRWARLWTVDGHRDTNQTACPGHYLYARLPAIRDRAQARVDRYS